jgi:Purine catabolism regulatory protein-like family
MFRVRDLLEEFGLEVLAGEEALDKEVRGVQVSDVLDPTPWLSPGELRVVAVVQAEADDLLYSIR